MMTASITTSFNPHLLREFVLGWIKADMGAPFNCHRKEAVENGLGGPFLINYFDMILHLYRILLFSISSLCSLFLLS